MATSILKSTFRTSLVKSILFDIISRTSSYHYVFGRKNEWPEVVDEETQESISGENKAPSVSDTFPYELEARADLTYAKAISGADIAAVIERNNWRTGTIYDMYDLYSVDNPSATGALSLEASLFYVINDEFNVYKCLNNNNGAFSLVKPTGTSREAVQYADGYIWKYMYTIPLALRNKFLTSFVMPVVTSLTNQFYSNGAITKFTIQSGGRSYVKKNTWMVEKIVVLNGGSGYSEDFTITFPPPPDVAIIAADAIDSNGSITGFTVVKGGYGYSAINPPQIYVDQPPSGGTRAIVEAIVTDGVVTSLNVVEPGLGYTTVPLIQVEEPEGGVSEGEKIQATAVYFANELTGEILAFDVNNPGAGYVTQPKPIVTSSTGENLTYKVFYQNDSYTKIRVIGDGYIENNPYSIKTVTVKNRGKFTQIPPVANENLITFPGTNIEGEMPFVKVTFETFLDGGETFYRIRDVHVINGGKGYTSPLKWYSPVGTNRVTSVALTDVSQSWVIEAAELDLNESTQKNDAILIPSFDAATGAIAALVIQDPGIGYAAASVAIESKLVTSDGVNFIQENMSNTIRSDFLPANIQLDFGLGTIDSRQADVELTAIDGAIHACKVMRGGTGYTESLKLVVSGDGEGCTVEPVIGPGGSIVSIIVTNPGKNYKSASIVVLRDGISSTEVDSPAKAVIRPIIAPKGGHGKDAIDELYASTVMITSRISAEKVDNTIPLESGYRRLCIIKNLKRFGIDSIYQQSAGTACIILECDVNTNNTSTFNSINIEQDQYIYYGPNKKNKYLIIEAYQDTSDVNPDLNKYYMLILPVNNTVLPIAGDSLYLVQEGENELFNFISTSKVSAPSFNKYSGDMIYLENRTKFYSTEEQAVRLTTSIKF